MKRTLFGILMTILLVGPQARFDAKGQPAPVGATIDMWQRLDRASAKSSLGQSRLPVKDEYYGVFSLDEGLLEATLAGAPDEFATVGKTENHQIMLPMPDGTLQAFRVWESSVMEPALAAEFPEIKTYVAQGVDDPTATARLDRTPLGFHAQILSASGAVYVDPYRTGDTATYISYDKRGLKKAGRQFECLVDDVAGPIAPEVENAEKFGGDGRTSLYANGGTLKTYRLALACTGEYATAVCNHNGVAVTVANTMAAMTTSVNRVTGIYEREVSIRLVLVANNSSIVFTNATTDPYSNTNASQLLSQNQTRCDSAIGSANYDIGHVFSTGGGGLAGLGVVCRAGQKAQGETGSSTPYDDGYDVDYVAHEMGHQFGGNHTFIGTQGSCSGNGNASTAYERGSGSTIQAYAGICGSDDLQPHSDDYFHTISLNEITNYTTSGAGTCSVNTSTGNTVPTLTIGANYTAVPVGTPFTLTAQSASDANGDALTYCWEDYQLGSANRYRPRPPTTGSSRTIPQISDVLAGSNSTTWETTATQTTGSARTFRCTVRDNRAGGGAYTSSTMTVTFVAGAFSVSAPNTAVSWAGNSSQTVTWTKGGSTAANVKISLSTNGGSTWTTVVASTANDGSEAITVPNTPSTTCRIKVEPTDNIYFDVSNVNFTITSGGTPTPDFALSAAPGSVSIAQGASGGSTVSSTISGGFNSAVALSASGLPSGATAGFSPSSIAAPGSGSSTLTINVGAATPAGTYTVVVTGSGGSLTRTVNVSLTVTTTGGGGNTINCGDSLSGSLATSDSRSTVRGSTFYADTYTFTPAASGQATITLNSSAFDCWLVLKSSASATTALAQDDDGNGGTNSKIVYTVTAGTTYYVEATSYSANATGAYTLALSCATGGGPVTLIGEGAESGAPGWTTSTNVTGNSWVVSAAGRATGANGFRTNNAATTYVNNLDQSLISPSFSLAGKTSASLTYFAKRQTESSYDFFRVEVSTNGGSSWTSLSSVSGSSSGFTTTAGSGMLSNTVSLTPYAGQANVMIRFRLTTDVSVTQWGVALDDVTVTAQ